MTVMFGIAVSVVALRVTVAQEANAIVVVGAGYTGTWDTEILLANPSAVSLEVLVGRIPRPCLITTCPPPVPRFVEIPPSGQTKVLASEMTANEVSYLFITPYSDPSGVPIVRARAFEVDQPSRAMELPAISYAQWLDRIGSVFVFPGALRSEAAYSNLSVVELGAGNVSYRVDAFDTAGNSVASLSGGLPIGGYGVLVDVLKQMNVTAFDGQIRLTQTGGDGVLAGTLATLGSDGSFAVSGGFNP
jgi:hypothetical protein